MSNEPYMIVESGTASEKQKGFYISFDERYSLAHKTVISDRCIEGLLFETLLWDYFCQHFYEWVRL